jgi:hypothetical protein
MARRLTVTGWILFGLGTFTGVWFLYAGLFLFSNDFLTGWLIVAGIGILFFAGVRALGVSWGPKPRPVQA